MSDIISTTATKLAEITNRFPIDWHDFDDALLCLEDINVFEEKYEESILSEYIMTAEFFNRGEILPIAIQHFLSCGYDVLAHDGRNGGLALSALCWSSYDHYILEAAKILMNAGAPVNYKSIDDDPNEEPKGLRGSISWKLSGAWSVDHDYSWANVLEAYYSMAEANAASKDYNSISCYSDCLGLELTAVSAAKDDIGNLLPQNDSVKQFNNSIIMWFNDIPLVIKPYIELIVNPVYVADNTASLIDVSSVFSPLIGAKLVDVLYLDSTICRFDFSNGFRLILASRDVGNKQRVGTFEIRAFEEDKQIDSLSIDFICAAKGFIYASTVTDYDETALAFFCANDAYLLHVIPGSARKYQLKLYRCSKEMMTEYTRQYPLRSPKDISCFYENNELTGIRFDYSQEYLYFKTTEYYEIEVKLSDTSFNPLECSSLRSHSGKHMEFQKRYLNIGGIHE